MRLLILVVFHPHGLSKQKELYVLLCSGVPRNVPRKQTKEIVNQLMKAVWS